MSDAKILIIDIERIRGKAEVPFWDLGEYKDRRINASHVVRWPQTICFAYRWYGTKKIGFHADWTEKNHKAMLEEAWKLYDQADIVVGHNTDSFDSKKLKAEWLNNGLTPPAPWKSFDTLKAARKEFGFESNTLDALCRRLGIPAKVDKYDADLAERALDGSVEDQERIKRYNKGDITASTALYEKLRSWSSHPNVNLFTGDLGVSCGTCGSNNLQKRGTAATTTANYTRFQCNDCGKWGRGKATLRSVALRSA